MKLSATPGAPPPAPEEDDLMKAISPVKPFGVFHRAERVVSKL